MNWQESAARIHWNIQPFINGRYRASTSTETFENVDPATERPLCRVAVGSATDVDAAVKVARTRFADECWSGLPPGRRGEILMRLADLIAANKAQLALLDTMEMGKPIRGALYDAETFAPTLLRAWAGFADKLLGQSAPLSDGSLTLNIYEPRGVVGAIVPWNFPTVNAVYKLGPALAAGNSVILKPSELASGSTLKIAELALEAGVPEGVLNVVPGLGTTVGRALAAHHDVDMLSFTGSTLTGRKIMELAGQSNAKPVLLECGGKSPNVVFDDAGSLSAVAEAVVQGITWNQGQVCSAHTRLIVHKRIKDALLQEILARASRYRPDNPLSEGTEFGPLASPAQRERVRSFIERGAGEGAVAVLKGCVQSAGGCYVSPTVFDRVRQDMSIAREEIFGPVLCVLEFASDPEAVELANATEYGLAATVWTRDLARAKRMARDIKTAAVMIRTSGRESPSSGYVLSYEPRKSSGFGAEMGLGGLQSYSTLKRVSFSGE